MTKFTINYRTIILPLMFVVLLLILSASLPELPPRLNPTALARLVPPGRPGRVPEGYYNVECPFEIEDIVAWLEKVEWGDSYSEDVFDCSEMAAVMEWVVEICGGDARLIYFASEDGNHVWLRVKTEGCWLDYETVSTRFVADDKTYKYCKQFGYCRTFTDLYAVERVYTMHGARAKFAEEFCWWEDD